jgi:uncharacterized Zn-finger protein
MKLCSSNGHMLTHRNKKPYECKADGCGKSYCDARSLRRHTENHHQPSGTSACSDFTNITFLEPQRDDMLTHLIQTGW